MPLYWRNNWENSTALCCKSISKWLLNASIISCIFGVDPCGKRELSFATDTKAYWNFNVKFMINFSSTSHRCHIKVLFSHLGIKFTCFVTIDMWLFHKICWYTIATSSSVITTGSVGCFPSSDSSICFRGAPSNKDEPYSPTHQQHTYFNESYYCSTKQTAE